MLIYSSIHGSFAHWIVSFLLICSISRNWSFDHLLKNIQTYIFAHLLKNSRNCSSYVLTAQLCAHLNRACFCFICPAMCSCYVPSYVFVLICAHLCAYLNRAMFLFCSIFPAMCSRLCAQLCVCAHLCPAYFCPAMCSFAHLFVWLVFELAILWTVVLFWIAFVCEDVCMWMMDNQKICYGRGPRPMITREESLSEVTGSCWSLQVASEVISNVYLVLIPSIAIEQLLWPQKLYQRKGKGLGRG